jgi:murein DD-endopeptidase MepM/ murein hydrolase activator NlpD
MDGMKKMRIARPLLLLLVLGLLGACTHVYTARGVYYRVRKGETLETVARRYRVDLQELAEVNNIEDVDEVKPGRSVYIPGITPGGFAHIIEKEGKIAYRRPSDPKREAGKKEKEAGGKSPDGDREMTVAAIEPARPVIEVDHGRFSWPIEGEVSSLFGIRRGRRHDGIDIRARKGTPVRVASDGVVVFSDRMRGYGNLILVKHDDGLFTVYAHNAVNLAKKGAKVKKGQIISKVGRTGRATGPHLHFEVREGTKARNPLFFLPKTLYAQKARERGTDYGGPEE